MNKVLLFAHLREVVGEKEIVVDGAGKTVSQLRTYLEQETNLSHLVGILFAINEQFVTDDTVIKAGDEIALIPPVSGG